MLVILYDNTNHRMQTNIMLPHYFWWILLTIFDPCAISNFPNMLFKDKENRYDIYLLMKDIWKY